MSAPEVPGTDPARTPAPAPSLGDGLGPLTIPSGHALLLFGSDEQRCGALASWAHEGVRLGQQVILNEASSDFPGLLTAMARTGLDVDEAVAARTLRFSELVDFYPTAGQESVVVAALAEGYPGVRMAGPAEHALTFLSPAQLVEVEDGMERLCARYPLSSLCQYAARPAVSQDGAGGADGERAADPMTTSLARHAIVADGVGLVAASTSGLSRSPDQVDHSVRPDGTVVVDVVGEFDGGNAHLLEAALARIGAARLEATGLRATRPGAGALEIDLAGLSFLGVAAGRALLEGTRTFRAHGGAVRIRGADLHLVQVLTLLRLADHTGIALEDGSP